MFRVAATGVDPLSAEAGEQPALYHDEGRTPEGRIRYWCAADKPIPDDYVLALKPVHRTTRVPRDAECEDCGIRIRELQVMLGDALDHPQRP